MARQNPTKPSVAALNRLLHDIPAGGVRMPILLQGEEEYRVEEARRRVIIAFFQDERERRDAVETISARDHDVASIVARASEAPLFASRHALVVRDAELLAKGGPAGAGDEAADGETPRKAGRSRAARRPAGGSSSRGGGRGGGSDAGGETRAGAAAPGRGGTWSGLPADAILILVARPGIDRRTRFYKEIEATGRAITFDRIRDEGEAVEWVDDRFRYNKKTIDPEGRRLLLEKTMEERDGVSLRLLASEIDKLVAYAGAGNRLTRADVELLVGKSAEEEVWAVARAASERSPDRALAALHDLVEQNEPMLVVMANLAREFRLLLDARLFWEAMPAARDVARMSFDTFKTRVLPALHAAAADAGGASDADGKRATRPLLGAHPYAAYLMLQQAGRYEVRAILGAIRELAAADRDLKGSGRPERLIMESLVVRLSGGAA